MLLILTGACLGGVGCGGTSSSAPPVTGTIAYLRLSSAQMGGQLVVMRVDGSRKRVFRHTFVNTTPVWSRDGSRIAFFRSSTRTASTPSSTLSTETAAVFDS
jgi:Tol biopolymer transport system component